MNELLSRVKELHKLNPKIDKKAKTLIVVKTARKAENLKNPSSCGTRRIEDLPVVNSVSTGKAAVTNQNNARKEIGNEKSSTVPRNIKSALNSTRDITADWKSRVWQDKANTLLRNGILNNSKSKSPDLAALSSKLNKKTREALDNIGSSKDIEISSSTKALSTISGPGTKLPNKKLSSDGLTKFLQLKVAILREELEGCSKGITKKTGELEESYETRKKLETEIASTISKNNTLTEQIANIEEKLAASGRKTKEREVDFSETNRELQSFKKEYRVMSQLNTNLEKRLYKVNEELETIKNNLSSLKEAQYGLKASTRQEVEAQERKIRRLKKQRSDILTSYKKYSSMHYQPLDESSYLQRC